MIDREGFMDTPNAWMGLLGLMVLSACGVDPSEKIAEADAATGDSLAKHSSRITDIINLGDDAALVQRFCMNAFSEKCPTDVTAKLSEAGLGGSATGVDLAQAFAVWKADELDGANDRQSTNEVYLRAAYMTVLAREPDEGGAQSNLAFIRQGGDRKAMLRSMLESVEFKSMR
jgi:hypothetical protein